MSEAGRGAWQGREEASWWSGENQQQQQSQQQQQEDPARSAANAAHQIFGYKMAASPGGAYDYRLGMGALRGNPGDPPQWWYNAGVDLQQPQSSSPSPTSQQQNNHNQSSTQLQQLQTASQQLQSASQQHSLQSQQLQSQQHLQQLQQQQIQQAQFQQFQQGQLQQQLYKGRMPRGKADIKPRGRMTAYAYFVQTCREEHKKKHPDENVVFAAFSKKCAERWKTMNDKEKQRFHEMAERDKKRYDDEMQNYIPPKGEKIGRGRKRRQIKDPNAPKRSLKLRKRKNPRLRYFSDYCSSKRRCTCHDASTKRKCNYNKASTSSAFFWFCNDERAKVKAINPEYGVGDIAKELGRRWADCDPESKSKYEALSENDKARYDREMTAYKKRPKPEMQMIHHEPPPEEDEDEQDGGEEYA